MVLFSSLQKCKDIDWRTPSCAQMTIEPSYRAWLLDNGSLTKKLIEKSKGHFAVKVLQQSVQAISFSERTALKLPQRQWAVLREVVLYGNSTPWVYARTVIPLKTLRGALRRLHDLQSQPLGAQLFAQPSMRREPVEVALLPVDYFSQTALPQIIPATTALWGRRSVFRVSEKPLLVSEIFLPTLLNEEPIPHCKQNGSR